MVNTSKLLIVIFTCVQAKNLRIIHILSEYYWDNIAFDQSKTDIIVATAILLYLRAHHFFSWSPFFRTPNNEEQVAITVWQLCLAWTRWGYNLSNGERTVLRQCCNVVASQKRDQLHGKRTRPPTPHTPPPKKTSVISVIRVYPNYKDVIMEHSYPHHPLYCTLTPSLLFCWKFV